ncbi:hypothetical protein [Paraburkholderia graminis]|uniref:Uncharacterized protein n=1 Tax=Paraburkholderia graminis TaxID=60548 RepID=A0ABD5C7R2_9BURK|nr:hypothetical protein [Paraburkholderia graminis]MDR6201289.1 hypothetical protein [Paraburkholderia graminis]
MVSLAAFLLMNLFVSTWTLLYLSFPVGAVESGQLDLVRELPGAGADQERLDNFGVSPLQYASASGSSSLDAFRDLLQPRNPLKQLSGCSMLHW